MANLFDELHRRINSDAVSREGNVIHVRSLKERYALRKIINEILRARSDGYSKVIFDFTRIKNDKIYANIATPLTAFCDHLKDESGIEYTFINMPRSFGDKHIITPLNVGFTEHRHDPLNKVWKFSSAEDVFAIVTMLIDAVRERELISQKDVLLSLEWSLSEVVDNVLQHSSLESGYVMGQLHSNEKRVVFCVADAGQGIYNSLRTSKTYKPADSIDAITLAMKEGVTRSKVEHQGNGLWGLHRIIEYSTGEMSITSSGARILINSNNQIQKENGPLLSSHKLGGGTVVDFQIDYSQPAHIEEALGGHRPDAIKILSSMSESGQTLLYPLDHKATGFGTRKSGLRIRNEIMNMINESGLPVIVDFDKVAVVSSSFADEAFGKMFKMLGPINFMRSIRLDNMNSTVSTLINKAIEQRFTQVEDEETGQTAHPKSPAPQN